MDYSLNSWAKQGVLLLNNSLTVEEDKPNSHSFMWSYFIKKVFEALNEYNAGIIFCLWGESNFIYEKYIGKSHYILKFEAPSKATIKQRSWDCPHFTEINKILEETQGKDQIITW
jgi:uracil-DNA glycosylase